MTVGAVLLAAGSARRMRSDKLLAELDGRPLALHAFEAMLAAGFERPIVAIAPDGGARALFAGRAAIVDVPDHALGMGHSLAAAMAAVPPDWTAVLIGLADMPFVRPATLRVLAARAAPDRIVRPSFEGLPGNPLVWGRDHFAALAASQGDRGGRDILVQHPPELLACDDPGVTIDIDTPEALEAARARL